MNGRGHVFHGRYEALLIARGASPLRPVNYIHLNPVWVGLQDVENQPGVGVTFVITLPAGMPE